jgi:hypothetical protein
MLMSIAALAMTLHGMPALAPEDRPALQQEIRYRRHESRPPPCGRGWDLDDRDNLCYRNGVVPRAHQAGRYYPLQPTPEQQMMQRKMMQQQQMQQQPTTQQQAPCPDRTDLDIRDGQCHPAGTVPRRYQAARQRRW